MVYKAPTPDFVPMFNANVYTESKVAIGKVEEVFGPLEELVILFSYFFYLYITN